MVLAKASERKWELDLRVQPHTAVPTCPGLPQSLLSGPAAQARTPAVSGRAGSTVPRVRAGPRLAGRVAWRHSQKPAAGERGLSPGQGEGTLQGGPQPGSNLCPGREWPLTQSDSDKH